MNHCDQTEELDEAEEMPHMATAELAGIERRSRRQFKIAREERIRVKTSE
jgi:hypothetical protein